MSHIFLRGNQGGGGAATGGTSDHGSLAGLLDDDHPQYLNENRLTGATHESFSASTITGTSLSTEHVKFDVNHIITDVEEGHLHWDGDEGTLSVGMPGGNVTLQIGQEFLVRVRNNSGADIPNGTINV